MTTERDLRAAFGVDLGGTTTALGLVAESGRLIAFERFETEAAAGPDAWAARAAAAADLLCRRSGLTRQQVAVVGVGSPGPLDLSTGTILRAANLEWEDVPLKALCEAAFSRPAVVDNDAVAALHGECWTGAGRGRSDVALVTLGTGVGGGLLVGGRIVRGARDIAGHIGHIIVEIDGRACGCGNRGCLEAYVGAPALVERCRQRLAGGADSALTAERELSARTIAEAAAQGDPLARDIFEEAARYLASALTSVAVLVDPEIFVISGAVAGAGAVLLEPLRRQMEALNFHGLEPSPAIVAGSLGVEAGVIGAAGLAFASLGEDPSEENKSSP